VELLAWWLLIDEVTLAGILRQFFSLVSAYRRELPVLDLFSAEYGRQ